MPFMKHAIHTPGPVLGLKPGELTHTSLGGLVRAIVADDKFELARYRELSDAVEQHTGPRMAAQTYLIPADMLGQRDMTVSGGTTGALVGAETLSFSNALSKRGILGRLPVQQHKELRNDAAVVRLTGGHSITWLAADGTSQIGDAQGSYGQARMGPKTVAATAICSRQVLLTGGPMAEGYVLNTLAASLAEASDGALIAGTGTAGQPLGLIYTTGVNSRAGTAFALSDAAAMVKVADGYGSSDSLAWVAGIDAAEDLRTRPKVAGGELMLLADGRMLDQPLIVSRAAPAAGLVLMPWSSLHFAQWGALELAADPYTYFTTGRVILRALWRLDFACESPTQVSVATALS